MLQQINWRECILWRSLNNSHEITCEQSSSLCNLQVLYALVVIVSSWDLICWQLSYLSMKWPIPFHGTFTWPVTYYVIKHRIRTDKFQPNAGPIAFCFVFMLHFFEPPDLSLLPASLLCCASVELHMSLVLMRAYRSHVLASTRKCILCLISSKLKVMENLDNYASMPPPYACCVSSPSSF